jgi:hypothetical protein
VSPFSLRSGLALAVTSQLHLTPSLAMLSRVLPSASRAAPLARAYASGSHGGAVSKPTRTFVVPAWGSGLIPMLGETPISEELIRKHFVVTEWSKDLATIKGHAPGQYTIALSL